MIAGSSASLTWGYKRVTAETLTYIEFKRIEAGGKDPDIGDINSNYVANVEAQFKSYMNLTPKNTSVILSINGTELADEAEYCCKIKTSVKKDQKCIHLKVLGKIII